MTVGDRSRTSSDRALMRQVANLLATDLSLGELFDRLTKMLPEYLDSVESCSRLMGLGLL